MLEPITVGVREAGSLLGVSSWTIRRWLRLGKLPAVKLGRRMVVEIGALRRFVVSNRIGEDQNVYDLSELRSLKR